MALWTDAQRTLIYELLGLFEGGTFTWVDYNERATGVPTSIPFVNQIDFTTATTRLETILTSLETITDGRQARIIVVLAAYLPVSLDTVQIKQGGGGGASGARYSSAKQRRRHKVVLMTLLGFRVSSSSPPQGAIELPGHRGRNISVSR